MSDRTGDGSRIRVLHLDDDRALLDVAEEFLELASDHIDIVPETAPERAIERLQTESFDCVISDYEMPGMTGLEFLEHVRSDDPELPFILFTGRGSEEIASKAISHGVTDYLEKESGGEQYTVLANRIENAVSQYRTEREIERRSAWYEQILNHSSDYVLIVDAAGKVTYASPSIERVMGYPPDAIVGTDAFEFVYEPDREFAVAALQETIAETSAAMTVEFRSIADDGSIRWLEARGRNFLDDPIIAGVMVNVRDITERKRREQAIERQKDHLQELTRFLTHDIRNQLVVVDGYIELVRSNHELEEIEGIASRVERIGQMIEKVGKLAQSGQEITDVQSVRLHEVIEACWRTASNANSEATLTVESDIVFDADRERLQTLLENLIVNALEHGGSDVTVRAGALDGQRGFFLEDDGRGISNADIDQIFDAEYTTSDDGTGLGLVIVDRIADAHGWNVEVTASDTGGARFEFYEVGPVSGGGPVVGDASV